MKKTFLSAFDDVEEEKKGEEKEEKSSEQLKRESELMLSRTRAMLRSEKHDMTTSEYLEKLTLKDVKPPTLIKPAAVEEKLGQKRQPSPLKQVEEASKKQKR